MPGMPEWILILIIVLLFFGAAKLPELARGLALAIKEFKKAAKDENGDAKPDEAKKPDAGSKPGNN